jgi:hypothetical protein
VAFVLIGDGPPLRRIAGSLVAVALDEGLVVGHAEHLFDLHARVKRALATLVDLVLERP